MKVEKVVMNKRLIKYFLLLAIGTFSCNKKEGSTFSTAGNFSGENAPSVQVSELNPSELVKYVQSAENGLKHQVKSSELIYTALYKPVDYVICMEEGSEEISKQTADTKRKELEEMQYIDLKIETPEGEFLQNGNPEDYSRKINYCSFNMQKDIKLIEGSDTLPCGMFHFERTNDIVPYATFLLGFPVKNRDKDKILVINDKLFDKGMIRLIFKSTDIKKTPALKPHA